MIPAFYFFPLACACSRGILNVLDRSILKNNQLKIQEQLFYNNIFTLLLGSCIYFYFFDLNDILPSFYKWELLLTAIVLQCISFSFSYVLKNNSIRDVILLTKGMDIFITPFLAFIICKEFSLEKNLGYILSCITALPLFWRTKDFQFLKMKSSYFLILALGLQFFIHKLVPKNNLEPFNLAINSSLVILSWRCIFSFFPFLSMKIKEEKINSNAKFCFTSIFKNFLRAFLMLISTITFIISFSYDQNIYLVPILNSSSLIALCLSSLILKEPIYFSDILSLIGLCFLMII